MKQSKILISVVLVTTITSPAYTWVPIVDDIKKTVEDVKNGVPALTCATVVGSATENTIIIAAEAGACASVVK